MSARTAKLIGLVVGILVVLPLAIGVGGWYAATEVLKKLSNSPSGPYGQYKPNDENLAVLAHARDSKPDGAALYSHYCANCHGLEGNGQGWTPLGKYHARNFTGEPFKFTNAFNPNKTGGGNSSDDHLIDLIRRGIAGSPMPAFGTYMNDEQIAAIVQHLRNAYVQQEARFLAKKQQAKIKAEASDEGFDPAIDWSNKNLEKWWVEAKQEIAAGELLAIPNPFPEPTPERLTRGEFLFKADAGLGCSKCHGPNGAGDGPQAKDPNFKNANGMKAYPRDLTAGVYRGGSSAEDIYRRVVLGIPGSPMPAHMGPANSPTPQDDLVNVVLYVKSLGSKAK